MPDVDIMDRGGDRGLPDRGNLVAKVQRAAQGIPPGGSTGQQLTKNSNTDFDATWSSDPSSAPYIATNVARVDTNGDDTKGKVGDLMLPFKTVAAAVTALEALGAPSDPYAIVLDTSSEDITTSLQNLTFLAYGGGVALAATAFNSLTFTGAGVPHTVYGIGIILGSVTANTNGGLGVVVEHGIIIGTITNSGGRVTVSGPGLKGRENACVTTIVSAGTTNLVQGFGAYSDEVNINSPGMDFVIEDTLLNDVAAANVTMNDSRFKPGGTLNITGTITYGNALLNTLQLLNPLPAAPTDIAGIIQTLADMGAWQQPL